MTNLLLAGFIWVGSLGAGFLGSLTGLGGGIVIVPLLTLVFKVDIRYAIGASLISVIATSSGSAAAYVKEGYTNLRIGMFLEIATTLGALGGAFLATSVPVAALAVTFGAVLMYSAYQSTIGISGRALRVEETPSQKGPPDRLATRLKMHGDYPTPRGKESYSARAVPFGFVTMAGAGVISGLLGIGAGAAKVLAMDQVMGLPFKVSTTTSNFMIGVTAAASAGVYLSRGYIDPGLAMPVMLGVLAGSLMGTRVLVVAKTRQLRIIFGFAILVLGIEMIFNGLTGRL